MAKGEFVLSLLALAVAATYMNYGGDGVTELLITLLMWSGIFVAVGAALVMLVSAAVFERLINAVKRLGGKYHG